MKTAYRILSVVVCGIGLGAILNLDLHIALMCATLGLLLKKESEGVK